MLKLDTFEDKSFEDVFNLAVRQVKTMDTVWNNHQLYDPGITLIELFSWLKVVQLKRMNDITKDTLLQFFKLLNISTDQNKPSRTLLKIDNLERDIIIPKGTKWLAGDMVFESEQAETVFASRLLKLDFDNPEESVTKEPTELNINRACAIFGSKFTENKDRSRAMTLYFDKAVESNIWTNIYFDVTSKWSKKRNPVKPGDDFAELAKLKWEYYGIKDGIEDWYEIEEVNDRTHCFLFSNVISFKMSGEMAAQDGMYKIRVTLCENYYDHMPLLSGIKTNIISVAQKDTVCENVIVKKRDIEDKSVTIRTNLAIYGSHKIYVNNKEGSWIEVKDYVWNKNESEGYVKFQIDDMKDMISGLSEDDDALMIVSYIEKRLPYQTTNLGTSNGTANQKLELDCKDIYYDDFEIMVEKCEKSSRSFDVWKKVEGFFECTKYDRSYMLDWEMDRMAFGDNEHAKIPDRLEDGIRLINLSYTRGKKSNIKSNIIDSVVTSNGVLKNASIEHIVPAVGGKDNQSFIELLDLPVKLFHQINRAVTYNDYRTIIMNTPGIIIENIKILPGSFSEKLNSEYNFVTIAIHHGEKRNYERYFEKYKENLKRNLEKYRLINTHIDVVGATYVGIQITGDFVINSYEDKCDRYIKEEIDNFVRYLNRDLGKPLRFGDLFSRLERLENIVYIKNLKITPKGEYENVTHSGDIIVKPNGFYYLDSINLNYAKDVNV
ncbi:MAG: hypothetical protein Q4B14_04295 [Clostridia bacterium]|nr:hypothetical protein [Clostridia bacterium]